MDERAQPHALFEILQLFGNGLALLMNRYGHHERGIDGRGGDWLGDDRAGSLLQRPGDAARRFGAEQGDDRKRRIAATPGQKLVPALVGVDDDHVR